jgi:hypothetical protein
MGTDISLSYIPREMYKTTPEMKTPGHLKLSEGIQIAVYA